MEKNQCKIFFALESKSGAQLWFDWNIFLPIAQRSEAGKVMFSQACVILFTGGVWIQDATLDAPLLHWIHTPLDAPPPPTHTHWILHHTLDSPPPPPPAQQDGQTVNRRSVRILAECILVFRICLPKKVNCCYIHVSDAKENGPICPGPK